MPLARRRSAGSRQPGSRSRGDPLKAYREKRDFSRTQEPRPRLEPTAGWQFVVQKHAARRLHYDFRLELDGVLKSWAVTRGPSLVPGEKRLAVQTEDHPMDYLEFEGVIPKGEYGGGTVIVWDRGRWSPEGDPHSGLAKGRLTFFLAGQRLKGRWHLVRMRSRPGENNPQWLLIKANDDFAREAEDPDILEEATTSTLTGRDVAAVAAAGEQDAARAASNLGSSRHNPPEPSRLRGAKKAALPDFVEPSLAVLSERPPGGADWVHEIKFDGYRLQARIAGKAIKLLTRKALDWTARFARVAESWRALGLESALLDGEVVVEDGSGIANFSALQTALKSGEQERFIYYVFDLLYLDGYDLRNVALVDRKQLLAQLLQDLPADTNIRLSADFDQDGRSILEHVCRLGLEGIISKRKKDSYHSGRGDHWIKSKCVMRQEFVILGYVPSTAAKGAIGSLVVGYYEAGKLAYAGRVGTGFSASTARALRHELDALKSTRPALLKPLPAGAAKGVIWTEPRLVAEVEFRGFTHEDVLRQASYKGLREDKPASEVVREPLLPKASRRAGSARQAPDFAGARLTHPERILWEEQGVTKQGLAEFYTDIADYILPHIINRPLSLVRCPSGNHKTCFYAKHAWAGLSDAIRPIDVGDVKPMLFIEGLKGLIGLVQAGVLEIHPWGSTINAPDNPDRLIFDFDPGDGVDWQAVIGAAKEARQRLADLGLQSFVKTSGGKGLHVMFPVEPTRHWDEAKAFAKSIADAMAADSPQRYVASMAKNLRRGKIFVDYLRNGRGATAVAAYSTRARPGAPVSTPLAWEELSTAIRADHFNLDNLRQRLDFLRRDPWAGFFELRQRLPSASARRRSRTAANSS